MAILTDGVIDTVAVSGEREISTGVSLEIKDKWHIGSITKSVTATMIARLIEKGLLDWTTTINDVFGATVKLEAQWSNVTILDLLTHTSGAPANFPLLVHLKNPKTEEKTRLERENAVFKMLRKASLSKPKSTFLYSNAGYTIAGAIAETLSGRNWETLIRQEVFEPLGLHSAGFGPPKSVTSQIEEPRGHRRTFLNKRKVSVDENADNTPIIGPAGTVHMSLSDLVAFGYEHLIGESSGGKLLSQDSYAILHREVLENYACGWVRDDSGACWHNGSNTMWYAYIMFEPRSRRVVAITANDPDISICEDVVDSIVKQVIERLV